MERVAESKRCGQCKSKMLASDISVIIAACNEPDLPNTVANIRETCPGAEIIVVDDMSERRVDGAAVYNITRQGCAGSRHIGALAAHGRVLFFTDAHMRFKTNDITRICAVAKRTRGFAYGGCNNHFGARLEVNDKGLLQVYWRGADKGDVARTTGMMGACYAIPKDVLERMGGWLALSGTTGHSECAMSILAAKCCVPITLTRTVNVTHEFRDPGNAPYTNTRGQQDLQMASMYRILFENPAYEMFAGHMADAGVSRAVLDAVSQSAELREYGRRIRERCLLSDEAFLRLCGNWRRETGDVDR